MNQIWDPVRYASEAAFVATLGAPLLDALAPQPGERILDLGCGDGTLTARLQASGCTVVGVDSSAEQVAAARARGLEAHVVDAQALRYESEFDGVFSNAALHWMPRQDLVLAGVHRALRPGGRFVGELGARGNIAHIVEALEAELAALGIATLGLSPWTFPGTDEFSALLQHSGFEVISIAAFERPTPFTRDLADWLTLMAQTHLNAAPASARPALLDAVTRRLRPVLYRDGQWLLDYVRLRFSAVKRA
jgi:trans-aconitate methyltransferase